MCCNDKYIEDIKAINDLFDKMNNLIFESVLSKPVITFQHDKKGKAYGWFTCWEAWQAENEKSTEINLSANFLDREPLQKAETLLHEMCHLYAYQNKIVDCSRSGIYHNKRFKEVAEKFGLIVNKTDKSGWSSTELSNETKLKIEPLLVGIQCLKRVEPKRVGKSSSTRKYICTECGISVRATKEVNIVCQECAVLMVQI